MDRIEKYLEQDLFHHIYFIALEIFCQDLKLFQFYIYIYDVYHYYLSYLVY